MSLFPDDDKVRKMLPIWKYFTGYFPKAHREVTKVCVVNNVRYNPDRAPADINWARGKSPDQLGSALRHMLESAVDGKVFEAVPEAIAKLTGIEKVYVLAEAAWRIHAELELTIEREEAPKAPAYYRWRSTVWLPSTSGLLCKVCGHVRGDHSALHSQCPVEEVTPKLEQEWADADTTQKKPYQPYQINSTKE